MTLEIRKSGSLVASGAPPAVSETATHIVYTTGAFEVKISKNDIQCLKPSAAALADTVARAIHAARLAERS